MNAPAPASVEDALRAELADAKAHIAELLERDAVLARDLDELAEHLDGQPMQLHAARRLIREMAKALRPLRCPTCGEAAR
jgi:hypothetical protein